MKRAAEAKIQNGTEKAAAAKVAFEAVSPPPDSDDSDADASAIQPLSPVDPSHCTAAGVGIAGAPATFVVSTIDSDGHMIPTGGAHIHVQISPGISVGRPDQVGMVMDLGDGTYRVTYAVPERGNYMVHIECYGTAILGSPFPVFFSRGTPIGVPGLPGTTTPFPSMVNQIMPNMPIFAASVSGGIPGLMVLIPGTILGSSGGVVLQAIGQTLGEICWEDLDGRCTRTDCKFNPPPNLLFSVLPASTTLGCCLRRLLWGVCVWLPRLCLAPMAPSTAALAVARANVAAPAPPALAALLAQQSDDWGVASGSPDEAGTPIL